MEGNIQTQQQMREFLGIGNFKHRISKHIVYEYRE